MRFLLLMLLFLSSSFLFAQDESNYDANEEKDISSPQEMEEITDEDQSEALADESKETIETDKQVLKVECVCPDSNLQEQEAVSTVNGLFPEDSVFLIAPSPPPPEPQVETPQKEVIPGYMEKVPKGYSDESYKQIPWE